MIRQMFGFLGLLIAGALLVGPQTAGAQVQKMEVAYGCYVPQVGAVYRIDPDGGGEGELQGGCFGDSDIPFSWLLAEAVPFTLPGDCAEGEIAHFAGGEWGCADPTNHTHTIADVTDFPTNFVSGLVWRHSSEWIVKGSYETYEFFCEPGEFVINATYSTSLSIAVSLNLLGSRPISNAGNLHSWLFTLYNESSVSEGWVYAHLLCATVH